MVQNDAILRYRAQLANFQRNLSLRGGGASPYQSRPAGLFSSWYTGSELVYIQQHQLNQSSVISQMWTNVENFSGTRRLEQRPGNARQTREALINTDDNGHRQYTSKISHSWRRKFHNVKTKQKPPVSPPTKLTSTRHGRKVLLYSHRHMLRQLRWKTGSCFVTTSFIFFYGVTTSWTPGIRSSSVQD